MRVTEEEVEAWGRKWAPRLHVTDWEVRYKVGDLGQAAGQCDWDWIKHSAVVTIDDGMPGVYAFKGVREGREIESVVVHELLHLIQPPNIGQIHEMLKDHPQIDQAFTDLSERMIDLFVRILLEADAGAWAS